MDHRQRYFAGPGHLRLDDSRGLVCQGLQLPPIHRSPQDTLPPSAVDLWRRGRAKKLEPLRPRLLLSGLETSRVSLPHLPSFQPSRPVQPRPPKAAPRRPLRTETGMD